MKAIVTGAVVNIPLLTSEYGCSSFLLASIVANTGASGVLGSAVRRAFESSQIDVLPLSFSRTGEGLVQLDLTNRADVRSKFTEFKPDCECRALSRRHNFVYRNLIMIRGHSLCCRTSTRRC